jgi:ribosome biogenesis GTPase / thiamine phosphate phosphatase
MEGKIVKIISNDYTVLSNNSNYVCKSRGKFKNINVTPLVGDEVVFDELNNYILEIKKRKNELLRPPVSNIDNALIIANVKPTFNTNLLDKLLCIIEFNNIKPIICFTKLDLLTKEELKQIKTYMDYYRKIGYEVYDNRNIIEIKKIFKNKITVLTGQSGAGKSTLLNKLDSKLNLKTDEISLALGRGKHTTRHVELLKIEDGLVADTPGFSSLDFIGMSNIDIRDNFIEFNLYKENCKYRDCMHLNEDECGIKNNPNIIKSRYENYKKFVQNNKR